MKRLTFALLFALSAATQADNFVGEVAFNATGATITQTDQMARDDIAVLWFFAPEASGNYTIKIDNGPGSPVVSRFVLITDGTYDFDFAVGYTPTFNVSVGG